MARGHATTYGPVLWQARAGLDRSGMWGLVAVVFGCLLAVPYQVVRQPDAELGQRVLVIGLTYLIVGAVVVTVLGILNATFQVTPTHVVKRRVMRRWRRFDPTGRPSWRSGHITKRVTWRPYYPTKRATWRFPHAVEASECASRRMTIGGID